MEYIFFAFIISDMLFFSTVCVSPKIWRALYAESSLFSSQLFDSFPPLKKIMVVGITEVLKETWY